MHAPHRPRRLVLAVGAAVALVGACSGDDDPVTVPSTLAPVRTTAPAQPADAILRIGALLPSSGPGASLGEPLLEAVELAVAEINQAGGVNGVEVELVTADEGDTLASAAKAASELIDAGVDAVVGPASSRTALGVLGRLVDAEVFTCSPTATALSLADFPDDRLFVRTIPSDALQAVALAELVEGAGVGTAALLVPDDEFGNAYADALAGALETRGITVTVAARYTADMAEQAGAALEVLETEPGAVVLIGNETTGRDMLATFDELAPQPITVVVNDALRTGDPSPAGLGRGGTADVVGASPRAAAAPTATAWFNPVFSAYLGADVTGGPASFAANAYDCISIIAVAAEVAGRNEARPISLNVSSVTAGGASCGNFVTCREFLEQGRNVDLNGASGPLELDQDGDVAVGWFDRFRFDADGRDVTVGDLQVTGS